MKDGCRFSFHPSRSHTSSSRVPHPWQGKAHGGNYYTKTSLTIKNWCLRCWSFIYPEYSPFESNPVEFPPPLCNSFLEHNNRSHTVVIFVPCGSLSPVPGKCLVHIVRLYWESNSTPIQHNSRNAHIMKRSVDCDQHTSESTEIQEQLINQVWLLLEWIENLHPHRHFVDKIGRPWSTPSLPPRAMWFCSLGLMAMDGCGIRDLNLCPLVYCATRECGIF